MKKEVPLKREECNYCEASFESKIKLRNHIKKVHIQLKKEVCNYCDVSFESKVKLEHHIKRIHLIENSDAVSENNANETLLDYEPISSENEIETVVSVISGTIEIISDQSDSEDIHVIPIQGRS